MSNTAGSPRAGMKSYKFVFGVLVLCAGSLLYAQSTPQQISAIVKPRLQTPDVVSYQLQQFLIRRAPKLPEPVSAVEWSTEEDQIRDRVLGVIFHGWPQQWVKAAPHFVDLGTVPHPGTGYQMRKLRYQIVPGFWSTAILYEPDRITGKLPAILDVNGHVGPEGKAVEYKQKRCINQALQGIIALNLEWIGMGELDQETNEHWFGGHLDLVGANAVGIFYLAMRRGLDYLSDDPHVDPNRLGVTGLSGGGWQTMLLSALDRRVKVSVPVAGYEALASRIPRFPYAAGDNENAGTDMFAGQDYATLTELRAPRPTLLIYNAEDNCCFRAALVKPYVFDQIKPFFRLYGKADDFQWHENTDPSTHNYDMDNRQEGYRFFTRNFGLGVVSREVAVDSQVRSYDELRVGIPKQNLTLLGLARQFASEIHRPPLPASVAGRAAWRRTKRQRLSEVVRYHPVTVKLAQAVWNTKDKLVESLSYRFKMSDGLPATGVWLKTIRIPDNAPISVIINDDGKSSSASAISSRVNRGDQVLALDLLFTGDDSTNGLPNTWDYPEVLAAFGERPLGMEAAQLIAVTRWLEQSAHTHAARLETFGIRSEVVGLVAAGLAPTLYSGIVVRHGMRSLGYLLNKPVRYRCAPGLFCLDLYKDFDLYEIEAIAAPTKITYSGPAAGPSSSLVD